MKTILILALAPMLACGGSDTGSQGQQVSVVSSFYPLAYAAERVAGGCVVVTNLTPAGVEPHDLELTPDTVEQIATADLVLYLGGGFQPAIEDAVASSAEGTVVDVLGAVSTVPALGEEADDFSVDPHVWLDPARYEQIALRISDAIDAAAVDGCDAGNSVERFRSELQALDDAYRTGLASCDRDLLVANHAAFGYLADAYGLRQEAIAGLEPEAEPTPTRMAEVRALVKREGVTTIFTEELVAPAVAETLAAEAGVETDVLFTIEGLTDEEAAAGEDYVSLMHRNLEALRVALGCT